MSIERTSPLKPVTPVQARETQEPSVQKARAQTTSELGSANVTLSDAQLKLSQPLTSDINQARVQALKMAIQNGELKMDTGKIADGLIQETRDYLQGK